MDIYKREREREREGERERERAYISPQPVWRLQEKRKGRGNLCERFCGGFGVRRMLGRK